MDKLHLDHYLKQCHGDARCEEQIRALHAAAIGSDPDTVDDPQAQGLAQMFLSMKTTMYRLQMVEQLLGIRFVDGEYQSVEDRSVTLLGQVADAIERQRRDMEG